MKAGRIRPLAIAIIRHTGRILVAEGYDSVKGQTFYRPLGGGIEFGERGADTVTRELREELGATLLDARYLGTLENIFTYEGKPGHEIVLVYEGTLAEAVLYRHDFITAQEDDDAPFRVVWQPLDAFGPGGAPLYPDGLAALLAAATAGAGRG